MAERLLCTTTIILVSVFAFAQPNGGGPGPVLGIVEIPKMFAIDPQTGHAAAGALTLYTRPDSNSKVAATLNFPAAIDEAEYGYEEPGALVYGRQRGYYLIRTARGVAWLSPADAGAFHAYEMLVSEGLAYLTDAWDGLVNALPGGANRTRVPQRKPNGYDDVKVSGFLTVGGKLWLQVEVMSHSFCTSPASPTVKTRGWILAHDNSGPQRSGLPRAAANRNISTVQAAEVTITSWASSLSGVAVKRIERKHLKEDELARTVRVAREFVEPRQQMLRNVSVAALILIVAGVGVGVWRERTASQGEEALADALVALNAQVVPAGVAGDEGIPAAASLNATGTFATEEAKLKVALPKLKVAADAYPGSPAGIQARYHMAGALVTLGRNAEAITAFDEVIKRAGGDTIYGQMAQLGKADAQSRAGQLDAAIETWKGLASTNSDRLPVDAILMQLARAYVQKGNRDEARKTFTEIVDKHPQSPYLAQARAELENLKG